MTTAVVSSAPTAGTGALTAGDVRRLWLGALPDSATDCLATAALAAIAERDAYRDALAAAGDVLQQQRHEIERQRERIATLADELRTARQARRRAA